MAFLSLEQEAGTLRWLGQGQEPIRVTTVQVHFREKLYSDLDKAPGFTK